MPTSCNQASDTRQVPPIGFNNLLATCTSISELHRSNGAIKGRTMVQHPVIDALMGAAEQLLRNAGGVPIHHKVPSGEHQILRRVGFDIQVGLYPLNHRTRPITLRRLRVVKLTNQHMLATPQLRNLCLVDITRWSCEATPKERRRRSRTYPQRTSRL